MSEDINEVHYPIVYIALGIIISAMCYGLWYMNRGLAIIVSSLFFYFLLLKTNKTFLFVIIIVFLIQIFNSYKYYSLEEVRVHGDIKIIKVSEKYSVGKYMGRKVYVDCKEKLEVGEIIEVNGKFVKDIDIENGIVGVIDIEGKILSREYTINTKLFRFRNNIYNKLKDNLGRRKAALVCSLSYGYTDYLDEFDKENFSNMGIIHAISVSGMHVAIIYSVLKNVTKKFFIIPILVIYVLFTSAPVSAVRALIMIIIKIGGEIFYRNYSSYVAIAISALITLIYGPYLIFNLGFQLSYLSTLGIIIFNKEISDKLYIIPNKIRDTVSISISAMIFTIPILIREFNEISAVSILGNVVIVPILNIIIIIGNSLIVIYKNQFLFDLLSYVLMKIIMILDNVVDIFYDISQNTIVLNTEYIFLYGTIIVTIFLMRIGYKKVEILPIIASIFLIINIYSPFLKIEYLKQGGLVLSYRGENVILLKDSYSDIQKLKRTYATDEVIINNNTNITMAGVIIMQNETAYILKTNNKTIYLDVSRYKNKEYNGINFKNDYIDVLYIIDNKIYSY